MSGGERAGQQPLFDHVSGPGRADVQRFLQVIAGVPLAGIERSVKFARGRFLPDRLLVGVAPAHWSAAFFAGLQTQLRMPPQLQSSFQAALARANFLFLALELDDVGGCMYKAYAEYAVLLRSGGAQDVAVPALQYHGFKWNPAAAELRGVTDYLLRPRLSRSQIELQLARHLANMRTPAIRDLLYGVLLQACARVDAQELACLDVVDSRSSRVSIDLNVYAADLPVSRFADSIASIAAQFDLDATAVARLLEQDGDQILGHVAAGRDRNDHDFLTVYYDH